MTIPEGDDCFINPVAYRSREEPCWKGIDMTTDQSDETNLTPYQEAIRLAASIDLRNAINSAGLKIWKDPNLRDPTLSLEAKSAYWSAVTTLSSAKVPLSDNMVHADLEFLMKLSHPVKSRLRPAAQRILPDLSW